MDIYQATLYLVIILIRSHAYRDLKGIYIPLLLIVEESGEMCAWISPTQITFSERSTGKSAFNMWESRDSQGENIAFFNIINKYHISWKKKTWFLRENYHRPPTSTSTLLNKGKKYSIIQIWLVRMCHFLHQTQENQCIKY